jgi:hypothetical protein
MHNEQKEMIISTLEDIKYSLELIQKSEKETILSIGKALILRSNFSILYNILFPFN